MLVLAIIVAFLVFLAFLRVGVIAEFSESGLRAFAKVGPIKKTVFTTEKRIREKPKRVKKAKKKKPDEEEKKPGRLSELKAHIPAAKKALSRLRRKLLIRDLTIHYIAGGGDPASVALGFGGASAAFGLVTALLENAFRVKRRDLRTAADFSRDEPYIYVRAVLSLAVWEIVYIASTLVGSLLKNTGKKAKNRKEAIQNGKTSNRRPDGDHNAEHPENGGRKHNYRRAD